VIKSRHRSDRGTSLIEVLITVVILTIGLLGLAKLQSFLQLSEMEAYQRSQALILLNDMVNRIANDRNNADGYVTSSPLGTGMTCSPDTSTRQKANFSEWCNALKGAGETEAGNSVGVMLGGRGCIDDLDEGLYLVTVAWQGLTPAAAPPTNMCGHNSYNGATGSACHDDLCRRVVSTVVSFADLAPM
jgi:type IV pilus assembly protein PilV